MLTVTVRVGGKELEGRRCRGGPPQGLNKCDQVPRYEVLTEMGELGEDPVPILEGPLRPAFCRDHAPLSFAAALRNAAEGDELTVTIGPEGLVTADGSAGAQQGMWDQIVTDADLAARWADWLDRIAYLRRAIAEADALEHQLVQELDAYLEGQHGKPIGPGKTRVMLAQRHVVEVEVTIGERKIKLKSDTPTELSAALSGDRPPELQSWDAQGPKR